MDIKFRWILWQRVALLITSLLFVDGSARSAPEPMYDSPVIYTQSTHSFSVGQTAILHCSVEKRGERKVVWRLASEQSPLTVGRMMFTEDPRISVEHVSRRNEWNLIIRNVQIEDNGVYECQIPSKFRHLKNYTTLIVTAPITQAPPPQKNIRIRGNNYVDEGGEIVLTCEAQSNEYPLTDVDWFRDGNALSTDPSRGQTIHKLYNRGSIESELKILRATPDDHGTYVCRASNNDVTKLQVEVLRPPVLHRNKKVADASESRSTEDNSENFAVSLQFGFLTVIASLCCSCLLLNHFEFR